MNVYRLTAFACFGLSAIVVVAGMSSEQPVVIATGFAVMPYPIFQEEDGNKPAFHLIHASDHPEAQKLMGRAYVKVVGDVPRVDTGRQPSLFT